MELEGGEHARGVNSFPPILLSRDDISQNYQREQYPVRLAVPFITKTFHRHGEMTPNDIEPPYSYTDAIGLTE